MKSRLFAVFAKEWIHIIRDPKSLVIIFLMPILMMLLFGYAITFEVQNLNLAVVDHSQSQNSRALIQKCSQSEIFQIQRIGNSTAPVEDWMLSREVLAVLVIPVDFDNTLNTPGASRVQILLDGSNANTAIIAGNMLRSLLYDFTLDLNPQTSQLFLEIRPQILYNPNLDSTDFVVPGLVAVLLMMICAMLTSITIVREKETGTLEQILVSPVRPGEIILGKVMPYIVLGALVAAVILGFSKFIFDIPIRGNMLLLTGLSLVYIYASLSLGVFISARTRTQQAALMFSLVGTLLPSILLSGFIFPIASMPQVLRCISYLVPARYYLTIIRGVLLKANGFDILWTPAAILLAFGTVLLMISMKRFKTHLEG